MEDRRLRYFTRVAFSFLLVTYLLFLLEKIDFVIKVLSLRVFLISTILVIFIYIWAERGKLKSIFKKIQIKLEKVRKQTTKRERKIVSNVGLAVSIKKIVWMLLAIFLFILFDIFSSKQTSDILVLVISIAWTIAGRFYGLDERITVILGLVFLGFCPFFIVFGKEILAEKSAVWAFFFLLSGIVQALILYKKEGVFPPKEQTISVTPDFKQSLGSFIDRITGYKEKPAVEIKEKKEEVIPKKILHAEEREVLPRYQFSFWEKLTSAISKVGYLGTRTPRIDQGREALKEHRPSFEEKLAPFSIRKRYLEPSISRMYQRREEMLGLKLSDFEVYKLTALICKATLEVVNSLSERKRKMFGNQLSELVDSIKINTAEAYGWLGYQNQIEFYHKIRTLLFKCCILVELMIEQKAGDKKLLEKLKDCLDKQAAELDILLG